MRLHCRGVTSEVINLPSPSGISEDGQVRHSVAGDSAATIARAASSREVRLREGLACIGTQLMQWVGVLRWLKTVLPPLRVLPPPVRCACERGLRVLELS